MDFVVEHLMSLRDEKYGEFQGSLIPSLGQAEIIGVRTPALRTYAKELAKDERCEAFLRELPHRYFEENQLHGFIISGMKDFDACIRELELFLPYIDNWATCDQTSPKVFKKHKEALLPFIYKWLESSHTYTIRFAIGMLMQFYLDEDFRPEYLEKVALIRSEEYYIRMEIAWYMATALAKQWEAAVPYVEQYRMERWTHNKTIQKAVESYRITDEQKDYLRTFRWKK